MRMKTRTRVMEEEEDRWTIDDDGWSMMDDG